MTFNMPRSRGGSRQPPDVTRHAAGALSLLENSYSITSYLKMTKVLLKGQQTGFDVRYLYKLSAQLPKSVNGQNSDGKEPEQQ